MVPKVRTPDEVILLDNLLTERGHETRLHIIIETNAALEAASKAQEDAKSSSSSTDKASQSPPTILDDST